MNIPKRAVFAAAFAAFLPLPRAAAQAKPKMAEDVFKNIQVLKGISVDDFLGTMGIMSAAVGFDCSECHIGAGTDKVDWAADTQKKIIARRMVTMVANINRENFSGRQMVTCWSCHHGRDRPATSPTLEMVYGPPSQETDDVLTQMPGQPPADQIIDKYLQALGGPEKLATLKSFAARGTSVGFGGFGGGGQVEIYAKFPDQRATFIKFKEETGRGDSDRVYNGKTGWIKTPLAVLSDYELTGSELDGARLDAELSFPAQIKQVLTQMRVSLPASISDLPGPSSQTASETKEGIGQDRPVNVVQGNGPHGMLATLYFDQKSGLLLRMVRYGRTPIGRVPTQIDYSDYRDVDGIKLPFRLTFAWLDGRDAIQLNELKINVPIDPSKFERPPSAK
ncbi:MAG TPA: photosynthetic reaction center cytochrome c subunit family protein [Bryobacteraceae bacterium]|jgi:photosynthetic reaction center cytochrome c subunit|nr:photosynthetic reaction center cytochrome c subunit family protein [Bryobacteraceae bacterium]